FSRTRPCYLAVAGLSAATLLCASAAALSEPVQGSPPSPALSPCTPLEVRTLEPANGSTVGPRPVFRISVRMERDCQGFDPIIQISRDGWKTIERSWELLE